MIEEVSMAFGENFLLYVMAATMLVGVLFCKEHRKAFFIPCVLISVVILNPFVYEYWYKICPWGYWRLLWILPVIPVCALIPSYVVEKVSKNWLKIVAVFVALIIFVSCGFFVMNHGSTTFVEATNLDKLPVDVVAVGQALLEIDEDPYVVSDLAISVYLRQFSGKIKSLYSRDIVFGGAITAPVSEVYSNLTSEDGDFSLISQYMLDNDYEYLVTWNQEEERKIKIDNAGFCLVRQVNGYGIYRPEGIRTKIKTYNSKHQVTSVTYVNRDGNAVLNDNGYATIRYEYATSGKLSLVYYFDENGEMLDMGSGKLHEYLTSYIGIGYVVFISAKDDASYSLTQTIVDDMKALGINHSLLGKYRSSFYAIVTPEETYDDCSDQALDIHGGFNDIEYAVSSAGSMVGNKSSIVVNGIEYSKNVRGLNIVVYDAVNNELVDSYGIDTHTQEMRVSR